uniref:Uncharacterized protein n=1 Tax=viral metagenome TaxID=1070528 RepID=A0A6C0EAC6_9ZZZZ
MEVQNLVTLFTTSCWSPLTKQLIQFMKTCDKDTKAFMNAKQYTKMKIDQSKSEETKSDEPKKLSFTDRDRYNDLVTQICSYVKTQEQLRDFTTDFDLFNTELLNCLKLDSVYELLQTNFAKGSYGKMIDDFNRILNPKKTGGDDDEEDEDITENIKTYVKSFSPDLLKAVDELIKSGWLVIVESINRHDEFSYFPKVDLSDEDEVVNVLQERMFGLAIFHGHQIFSIYSISENKHVFLTDKLVTDGSTCYNASMKDPVTFINEVNKNVYTLNPVHLINFDTFKRTFFSGKAYLEVLSMLNRKTPCKFYKGKYLASDDYNDYDELKLTNAIKSFSVGYEDYAKFAMAFFFFDKVDGKITVNAYWMLTKDLSSISEFDRSGFEWNEITNILEFFDAVNNYDNPDKHYGVSVLH